ncbi:MAG: class I SAM-dependent methyltransferase [Microcoleaceae cyanobacterium]
MTQLTYIGTELELFAQANHWKSYIVSLLNQYIQGDVLEVGAGIGSHTKLLTNTQYHHWLCLEPDLKLFQTLEKVIINNQIINCTAKAGTIEDIQTQTSFDTIIYLDVLEHIEADKKEVLNAAKHLKNNGSLIVLAPAHQYLFTPFDTAIGHYRRYNKQMLKAILPEDIEVIKLVYLDCVGLLASLANKLLLQQSQPTLKQIQLWDQLMVPLSIKLDPMIRNKLGKSILLIGKKRAISS